MKLLKHLARLFYPHACQLCGDYLDKYEQELCLPCLAELPYTQHTNLKENSVLDLFEGRVSLFKACAYLYFSKDGEVQKLLHSLKYQNNIGVGMMLGRQFGQLLADKKYFGEIDYVVSVPLHPSKRRKRGYNQSEIISKAIAEQINSTCCFNNLSKQRTTRSQTRKGRWDRWENVEDVFFCKDPSHFEGKHLLLVDDIITTGATLEACVRVLQKSQHVKISIAVIALANH